MRYLACDLGAESGRIVAGSLGKGRLNLELVHRFSNQPVWLPGGLRWDTLGIFREIVSGLVRYRQAHRTELAGISCDSWGVDFGLLDKHGQLVGNPNHYRSRRFEGAMEKVLAILPAGEIYRRTGIQFLPFNTIYQLYTLASERDPALEISRKLLMTADLVNFFLSGEAAQEFTLATTSQLYDPNRHGWAAGLFRKLDLPLKLMPAVTPPATVIGKLRSRIGSETGLAGTPVIAGASHDTAAAVAACPARPGERFAYLSSGTWSLLGVELKRPLINETVRAEGFTNEGGLGGTYRFLHNITGLWILQECRRAWQHEGRLYEYPELTALAAKARPFQALINPDHPDFLAPEKMPEAVAGFCRKTGQRPPPDRGGMVRVILESLALRYGQFVRTLNRLGALSGPLEVLYVVGGGSQNELLNQFTANATGIPVVTGPVEATAAGNILAQALAAGEIASIWEGRAAVRAAHDLKTYRPAGRERWTEMLNQMEKVCSMA